MKRVTNIEERIPALKKRRKRRINRRFYVLLALLLSIALICIYYASDWSSIKQIKWSETDLKSNDYYLEQSALPSYDRIIAVNVKEVERRLLELPTVKEVDVQKHVFKRTVTVDLVEYEPVAYIDSNGLYSLLLENGVELEGSSTEVLRKLPILSNFETEGERKKIAHSLSEVERPIYELISEIIAQEDDPYGRVTFYMDDGNEVRGLLMDFPKKLKHYPNIVAQLSPEQKGVLDIEVGVYFTPYDVKYQQEPIELVSPLEEENGDGTSVLEEPLPPVEEGDATQPASEEEEMFQQAQLEEAPLPTEELPITFYEY